MPQFFFCTERISFGIQPWNPSCFEAEKTYLRERGKCSVKSVRAQTFCDRVYLFVVGNGCSRVELTTLEM